MEQISNVTQEFEEAKSGKVKDTATIQDAIDALQEVIETTDGVLRLQIAQNALAELRNRLT